MLDIKQEFERFKQGLRQEARLESKVEAILQILRVRGVALSEDARQRIQHCTDQALLDCWLARAAVAQSIDEVLRPAG